MKANRKGARKLRRRGRLKVRPKVIFAPTGGEPNTKPRRVKLIRKR